MSWEERIQEAALNTPSGVRLPFQFEDVSVSFDRRTVAYSFPLVDGTYVQDQGTGGRRVPLRMFFWGVDHDLEAAVFSAALSEKGTSKLEHPRYGVIDVLPFGEVNQRDDLKTGANQTIFEVTFYETIGPLYPTATASPGSSVLEALEAYAAAGSNEFADTVDTSTAFGRSDLKAQFDQGLVRVNAFLAPIAETLDAAEAEYREIEASINAAIDQLIATPLTLAFQTYLLVTAPARSASAVKDQLAAYAALTGSLIAGQGAAVTENQFRSDNLLASDAVAGACTAALYADYQIKSEAIAAAEAITAQLDALVAWQDDTAAALGVTSTGGGYQAVQQLVATTAEFLVQTSFNLKRQDSITLGANRAVIELEAELYGTVDENLDLLINTNNLTGSELIELPRGRRIVYYV